MVKKDGGRGSNIKEFGKFLFYTLNTAQGPVSFMSSLIGEKSLKMKHPTVTSWFFMIFMI